MLDLRFAVRQLLKNPGFTLVAVITLAVGIGANTLVFSVTKAVLFRPLAFTDAERLMWIRLINPYTGAVEEQLSWQDMLMSQLFELSPHNPWLLVGVSLLVTCVAVAAQRMACPSRLARGSGGGVRHEGIRDVKANPQEL